MRLYPYLCINGTELANANRTQAYLKAGLGPPEMDASNVFTCPQVDDGEVYLTPAFDDAPWYDSGIDASTEFFGIYANQMDLLSVHQRDVKQLTNGGVVGPLNLKPRVLSFSGTMVAKTWRGMAYGERWVSEVLAGNACPEGCCMDEVTVLPACPDNLLAGDEVFRRLVDVGIVDGPVFSQVENLPECKISQLSFQMAAGVPYLVSPELLCLDEPVLLPVDLSCCHIDNADWPGDSVPIIKLTAATAATDIHLTGKVSFNGLCPVTEAMPCWEIRIPSMVRDSEITIDAVRRQIRYKDPSLKVERSGLRYIEFEGPLTYPEISPCSDYCVCGTAATGTVTMTVSKVIREI